VEGRARGLGLPLVEGRARGLGPAPGEAERPVL